MRILSRSLCAASFGTTCPGNKQEKKLARKTVTSQTQSWLSGLLSAMVTQLSVTWAQGLAQPFPSMFKVPCSIPSTMSKQQNQTNPPYNIGAAANDVVSVFGTREAFKGNL